MISEINTVEGWGCCVPIGKVYPRAPECPAMRRGGLDFLAL